MSIIDDFKKLFWAKKSVAKSTARKVGKEAKDLAEEGYVKVKDLSGKVVDKAEDAFDDVRDYTSDLIDKWNKEDEGASTTSNTSASTTSNTSANTNPNTNASEGDAGPKQRDSVVDKAVEMSDKVWEKAEDLSEKTYDKAKDLAKKAGEKIDSTIDEMLEKAKELDKKIEEEKDAIDKNRDGFADKPLNEKLREHDSLLKDKDDFWAKADQYGKGDYTMGKPQIVKKDKTEDDKLELKPIKGFTDDDGDGDSLIDDADIVDDDDDKK
jgi:ElaB/YqjD/DUF883 family membrane-anchored ribosome-binding protein